MWAVFVRVPVNSCTQQGIHIHKQAQSMTFGMNLDVDTLMGVNSLTSK